MGSLRCNTRKLKARQRSSFGLRTNSEHSLVRFGRRLRCAPGRWIKEISPRLFYAVTPERLVASTGVLNDLNWVCNPLIEDFGIDLHLKRISMPDGLRGDNRALERSSKGLR